MCRPKIGISTTILTEKDPELIHVERVYVNREYVSAVERTGGLPVILPVTTDEQSIASYVSLCDGFLFSGGADINPLYYSCPPHPKLGRVHSDVDRFQIDLMKYVLDSGKPVLSICRGMQLLNVVCGGDLYQDMEEVDRKVFQHEQHAPKYDAIHKVCFTERTALHGMFGDSIYTNSYHHQAVRKVGKRLVMTGCSEDGIIEAIELEGHPFCIGVQWHPEMMYTHSDDMRVLFIKLIESCR